MRTLVVYYSLGGTTRKLALALAKTLGAEAAEIACSRYTGSTMDFLKACYESMTGRLPQIAVTHGPLESYDLVFVGGPIWAGHAATPVRAYLNARQGRFKRLACFVTHGGSSTERALAELGRIAGAAPQATLALRTGDVLGGSYDAAVDAFVQSLSLKQAA